MSDVNDTRAAAVEMSGFTQQTVTDKDGVRGIVEGALPAGESSEVSVRLSDGQRALIPREVLIERQNGDLFVSASLSTFATEAAAASRTVAPRPAEEVIVIPVVTEELHVEKREVEASRVRIHKTVRERIETWDEPLVREEVKVERVPVNQVVEGPIPVRHIGDTMIVPLLEEVLVVEKRLVLKEELHITRQRVEARQPQTVTLRTEEATVERLASGPESATHDRERPDN